MAQAYPPSTTSSFIDTSVGREYFYEAKRLAEQGRHLEAKRYFKFVIQLRPDAASPHFHLGNTLIALGAMEEAISHFKKATRIKPDIIKYRQFLNWYRSLYQCKYRNAETPKGPSPKKKKQKIKKSKEQIEEKKECKSEEADDDGIDIENITNCNQYNEDYYELNKNKFSHWSMDKLLREFCPNKYWIKSNATNQQKLKVLKQAIKLYHPKNNENSHQIYYKFNTKNHPELNQKHLFDLLTKHKCELEERIKMNKIKNIKIKNSKKHSNCPYCFVPISVVCEHVCAKKKRSSKKITSHKYHYYFE